MLHHWHCAHASVSRGHTQLLGASQQGAHVHTCTNVHTTAPAGPSQTQSRNKVCVTRLLCGDDLGSFWSFSFFGDKRIASSHMFISPDLASVASSAMRPGVAVPPRGRRGVGRTATGSVAPRPARAGRRGGELAYPRGTRFSALRHERVAGSITFRSSYVIAQLNYTTRSATMQGRSACTSRDQTLSAPPLPMVQPTGLDYQYNRSPPPPLPCAGAPLVGIPSAVRSHH